MKLLKHLLLLSLISFCVPKSDLFLTDPIPPVNPTYYSHEWWIYTMDKSNNPPEDPERLKKWIDKGHGKSFYDWETRSMIEIYDDFCEPIFEVPDGEYHFPCNFLNFGEKAYLYLPKPNPVRPACCLFADNWHPPSPNAVGESTDTFFLKEITMSNGKVAEFWQNQIDPPGPFWYGWYKNVTVDGYRQPAAFSFLTLSPEDFTQQEFYNFKVEKPDPSVFALPKECEVVDDCVIFGNQDKRRRQ